MFKIIDTKTGLVVGTRNTLKAASKRCDKLDLEYGAVRYVYKRA